MTFEISCFNNTFLLSCTFAGFEQVKKINSHFADFKQV